MATLWEIVRFVLALLCMGATAWWLLPHHPVAALIAVVSWLSIFNYLGWCPPD
jgi:hypothetical protein